MTSGQAETVAAAMLDTDPAEVTLRDGRAFAPDGESIPLRELSFAIYTNAFGLARLVDPPLELHCGIQTRQH